MPEKLRRDVLNMNIFNSVFVDCTASKDVAQLYQSFLEHNISVVAANKIAASSDYESYARLKSTAMERGVFFRFETNVGAGLPIIGTINDLRNSGDQILKIEAVLSGTLNFIFNEIAADVPFSETVRRAKEQGYSEPDPRIDLSGKDVVRKLVILAREAGYKVEQEDVEKHLFVPDEYFEASRAAKCLTARASDGVSWPRWKADTQAYRCRRWPWAILSTTWKARTTLCCSPPNATSNTQCRFRDTVLEHR